MWGLSSIHHHLIPGTEQNGEGRMNKITVRLTRMTTGFENTNIRRFYAILRDFYL